MEPAGSQLFRLGNDNMERTTRQNLFVAAAAGVIALMTPAAFSAQSVSAGRGTVPVAMPSQPQMPPTRLGLGPQNPGLAPLAVSQLEEGRRNDAIDQTISLSFAEPISVRELLLLLVRDTNLSVVPDPYVEGQFSG